MRGDKLMVRLGKDEKNAIYNIAKKEGIAPSSWARMVLLRTARNQNILKEKEEIKYIADSKGLELLSLFCGAGGLDQGFADAGFHTALAFDIDKECINTFNINHRESKGVIADLREMNLRKLDELYGGIFKPIGVIGGPPCQSFSVSNVHQSENDPRHSLPEAYARLLKELNARNPISFFLFENVPGLLSKKHIHRYEKFKNLFINAGFKVFETTLDAKFFGVPQERERIFIVGINKKLHGDIIWTPPEKEKKIKTVRETIGGIPEPIENGKGLDQDTFPVHPNHWCLVPRSRKFIAGNLTEGQMYGRSFRTLYWDKPSWTVAYGHREVHVHPSGRRRLSIYEAMLLQTFPRNYRLTGNMSAQIRLVSEAVPVRLAWRIALSIRNCLGI
jgi:DNA (cytosine-5)-methyltransferase 1